MQWVVLGSGTLLIDPNRGSAAHLLRGDDVAALFDTGSGTKDRLARADVSLLEISHIVYSHAHVDHWADLLSLMFLRGYLPDSRKRSGLVIAGPPGFADLARSVLQAASPSLLAHNNDVVWVDVGPGSEVLDAGWFQARAFKVEHGSQTAQAYRIQGSQRGRRWSVAYSGDCELCEGLVQAAQGVDCLVCECSLSACSAAAGHMTPASVRALADRAHPKRIVLTHLFPEVQDAEIESAFRGYPGHVLVGEDGLSVGVDG
jgi:ribonuclease BN (tRNA processing enzyme)